MDKHTPRFFTPYHGLFTICTGGAAYVQHIQYICTIVKHRIKTFAFIFSGKVSEVSEVVFAQKNIGCFSRVEKLAVLTHRWPRQLSI
jgi:hypothetical protein